MVNLVVGLYQPIGEPGVDGVFRHLPSEGMPGGPLSVLQRGDGHLHTLPNSLFQELLPLLLVKTHLVASCVHHKGFATTFGPCLHGLHIVAQEEVERGDVGRNAYVGIVGIDVWLCGVLHRSLWSGCAGSQEQCEENGVEDCFHGCGFWAVSK